MSPNRGLGQNFLIDARVRDEIAERVLESGDQVLEIGPGLGALTQGLLERGARVFGVELDPGCASALGLLLSRYPDQLSLRVGDILANPPGALGIRGGYVAAGNLPYQITGALLPQMADWEPAPLASHFLLQREVAERLAAAPGDWSLATMAVRMIARAELQLIVPPECFWPRPKVQSALIRLVSGRAMPRESAARLLAFAAPVFQLRRKQLHHGVGRALGVDPAVARTVVADAGLASERRPGTLDLEEWGALLEAAQRLAPGSR